MDDNILGVTYALAAAVTWSGAVIILKRASGHYRAIELNILKTVLGLILIGLTSLVIGTGPLPENEELGWLLLSGVVGVAAADSLFLAALARLNASSVAIIEALYTPTVVLAAVFWLGETLSWLQVFGALLIAGAVFIVSYQPKKTRRQRPEADVPSRLPGILFGSAAMFLMAFSIVGIKPILAKYEVHTATAIRLGGALVGLVIWEVLGGRARVLSSIFKPRPHARDAVLGSILGAYVALLFWVAGFKYATASISGVLNQTSTLFTIALAAVFLKEAITAAKVFAGALGFVGCAILLLA